MDGDWIEKQESVEVYLVSLDMRSKSDLESFTRLQHLKAISLNNGLIQDCGRRGYIFYILADERFTKRSVRWQGMKSCRVGYHFLGDLG